MSAVKMIFFYFVFENIISYNMKKIKVKQMIYWISMTLSDGSEWYAGQITLAAFSQHVVSVAGSPLASCLELLIKMCGKMAMHDIKSDMCAIH